MIFDIPRLIEHVSSIMTLEVSLSFALCQPDLLNTHLCLQEGDLLLTGTPEGVGPVVAGENVSCSLKDEAGKEIASLEFDAIDREGGYHFQP